MAERFDPCPNHPQKAALRSLALFGHDGERRLVHLHVGGGEHLLWALGQGSVEILRQRRFLNIRDAEHPWLRYLPAHFLGLEWLLRKRSRLL